MYGLRRTGRHNLSGQPGCRRDHGLRARYPHAGVPKGACSDEVDQVEPQLQGTPVNRAKVGCHGRPLASAFVRAVQRMTALGARAGTLTQNRMEAVRLWVGGRCYSDLIALTAPSVEMTYTVGPCAMTGLGPCSKDVAPGARCCSLGARAGTLTQNRMEAVRLWVGGRCYADLTALTAPSVER